MVELLAPAGDLDCVRAAVENGADAIYFGLDVGFNARARATNISLEALPELMAFLHRRQVRGYVTFNTLVFSSELESAERLLRQLAAAGVDALLVQDLGLAQLSRRVCPGLSLHASTQMTLTSAAAIEAVRPLGIDRVVLARELSLPEISEIHEQSEVPLEAFAHGALCVAYSGQCLTSEALGGRSANRGQCAQACRLPYELVCDGETRDLGDVQYLLSPQDLAAFSLVPEMLAAGVISFKIEGRLKTPEYVANITRHYRMAIDSALAGHPVVFTPRQVEEMELSFSRGFSPGWLQGCDHKMLVPGKTSAKQGVSLGKVTAVRGQRIELELHRSLAAGYGIVFAGDRTQGKEQGGRVYGVFQKGKRAAEPIESGLVEIEMGDGAIDFERIYVGQEVRKSDEPALTKALRKTYTSADPQRRSPIDLHVTAVAGEVLKVRVVSPANLDIEVTSEAPLEVARKHALTEDVLQTQLDRLGGTNYRLASLTSEIAGNPMVPLSVLGTVRKQLVTLLDERLSVPPPQPTAAEAVLPQLRAELAATLAALAESSPPENESTLHVLCRTLEQLEVCLELGVRRLYVDFADIREYAQAVQMGAQWQAEVWLATPRIEKPGEQGVFRSIERKEPSGVLVRNLGGLTYFTSRNIPCVADFSLNATNELSIGWLLRQGVRRVTPSYDCNRDQLLELVSAAAAEYLEVVIHQHMPMFHMEHCVFCAVLSPGTNKHNCGRPCDHHAVHLRDRVGMEHRLTADVGCRNTLFNAVPQSGAEVVPDLQRLGVRNFRIELLEQTPAQIEDVVYAYQSLLRGERSPADVWRALKALNRVGITRGTLEAATS